MQVWWYIFVLHSTQLKLFWRICKIELFKDEWVIIQYESWRDPSQNWLQNKLNNNLTYRYIDMNSLRYLWLKRPIQPTT